MVNRLQSVSEMSRLWIAAHLSLERVRSRWQRLPRFSWGAGGRRVGVQSLGVRQGFRTE